MLVDRFPIASHPAMMASQPPSSRIALVEKLVWAPAPFQSPRIGLGSRVANTPKSSAMRKSSQRATHSWSPMSRGDRTPSWNSHWPIITSAFVPSMAMPASMQATVWSSTISRPGILSPPTPQ